jgi:hypothetical protein
MLDRLLHQPPVVEGVEKPTASSTQFTLFVVIPTESASKAWCGPRPGRNPYENPRKSTS